MTRATTTLALSTLMIFMALALAACGDDSGTATDTGTGTDTSVAEDAATGDTGGASCEAPASPYGTEVGRNFEPFTLDDCNGQPYDFYNEEFCAARLTVVSIAAGWCMPCILESRVLEAEINQVYGPQGVRVIQIITQKEDNAAPDEAYCQAWVETYGLTNVELIDPLGFTSPYFPANSLPAALIVDDTGTIVYREYGYSGSGLPSLRAQLDSLLAE